jgi:hypothetical protein
LTSPKANNFASEDFGGGEGVSQLQRASKKQIKIYRFYLSEIRNSSAGYKK